ncbi:MAG: MBL fold metallo-hydrolase [Phycisphaerae bacterium]
MPDTLFLEVVRSPGLAHMSYMVGHAGHAAVIDARRDGEPYLDLAGKHDCRIDHIFETHKNEDYITGSLELQRRTGAQIHHGPGLEWGFGNTVDDGDEFHIGNIRLRVLHTPGHTDDSISIALSDTSFSEDPVAVFTGDALFLGDVGRTDFYPDRPEEVAGLLYDSLFEKLLPLGDHVLLYPAHGAGSVCGSGMASRNFSSIGYERKYNPSLQVDSRDEFIQMKVNEHHYQPPYFRRMEEYNKEGSAPPLAELPSPEALEPGEFADRMKKDAVVVDIRDPEAFAGSFVPGSINIPADMIAAYAGWLLPYDKTILLVAKDPPQVRQATRPFVRLGYDNLGGYLRGGLHGWETSGRPLDTLGVMTARELKNAMQAGHAPNVLDVRKIGEWQTGHLESATHVFLGHLPEKLDEVPRDGEVVTFCGSGKRASIAASLLKRAGFEQVTNNLGSMEACQEVGCELVKT